MAPSRYKLIVEYDGSGFAGWQRQVHDATVQSVLENAIFKLTKIPTTIFAAGRTDAGVHATHQVVHFETTAPILLNRLIPSLNFFVRPYPVCIVEATMTDFNFHARFSALSRSYIYKILNRPNPSVLLQRRAWHVSSPLNAKLMHKAAQQFIGRHDFTSFRSARCQSKSPIKAITNIAVTKKDDIIEISITAPSFLHNQVRIITGALKKVGEGTWTELDIIKLLEIKDRTLSAPTAPAHGLYLTNVEY